MFVKDFWIRASERALKSAGQFGLTAFGATIFTSIDQVAPAAQIVGLAALSGLVLSYLTSIASTQFGDEGTPSLVKEAHSE